jgi:hypothetical protein
MYRRKNVMANNIRQLVVGMEHWKRVPQTRRCQRITTSKSQPLRDL